MSEVSDRPDVGDVQRGSNLSVPLTREDRVLARIDNLMDLLKFPLIYYKLLVLFFFIPRLKAIK